LDGLTRKPIPVAHIALDGNPDTGYYLTIDSFKSKVEIPTGYVYLFYLNPPEDHAFWAYWEDRGVYDGCTGVWEPIIWAIISGEPTMFMGEMQSLHMFGFCPSFLGQGPKLIDSLQYYLAMFTGGATGCPMSDLMLNGDYPPGTYEFTCLRSLSPTETDGNDFLNDVTMKMKIR
jgi:hypothetical protein